MARKIIEQLLGIPGLKVQCPNCDEEFPVRRAKIFSMYDSYPPSVQRAFRERFKSADELELELKERKRTLAEDRKKKPEKIAGAAQGSNFGKIAEQIIPAFITFPYQQAECRPLFEPVDYVIFRGLASRAQVEAINFVDVKTGNARLSKEQRQIRDRIGEGKINHKVIGE
jgi:predicted Holliday junction resolvase-like endonuclease